MVDDRSPDMTMFNVDQCLDPDGFRNFLKLRNRFIAVCIDYALRNLNCHECGHMLHHMKKRYAAIRVLQSFRQGDSGLTLVFVIQRNRDEHVLVHLGTPFPR